MFSQSTAGGDNKAAPPRSSTPLSNSLNRLISAVVVSPRFRQFLFSEPVAALAAGYNGETFQLTPAEYSAVTSLRVTTARDFAVQLLQMLQFGEDAALSGVEVQPEPTVRRTAPKGNSPASDNYRPGRSWYGA
jgi:hypothetical protein